MNDRHPIDLRAVARRSMAEYGFHSDFPPGVIRETQTLIRENSHIEEAPISDLRNLLWSSIDNVDSKDLDQLEFCERMQGREIRVLVAIADVDHFVGKGSLTDRHAGHNGTSVYTGVETFPMLPESLCNDASSLIEHADRHAVVIEFFVKRDGSVRAGDVFRAIVKNKAKLIYEEIGEWLESADASPPASVVKQEGLDDQVRLQNEAAERLQKFRMESGALELETLEPRVVMFNGTVRDLIPANKNRARYIIENFMVAANGTMVAFLEKHQRPHIERVVRIPERWPRIVSVAAALGEELSQTPDSGALSQFLARRRQADPERFPDLSLTIVKLLGAGEYVMAQPGEAKLGHFGLAVQDYTHSTAPNRRYVDIIIQRLIKSVLRKEETPYSKHELSETASWCTERDKAAKKVERFMRKVAAAVLLSGRVGEVFEGIVTGASDKGTYVRLFNPPAEGRVVRGEGGMDVGEKVKVRLMGLDLEKGYVDFSGQIRTGGGSQRRDLRFPFKFKRPFRRDK